MTAEELLYKVADILDKLNMTYAITGGFAVAVWGNPRYTADIDIVIKLKSEKIDALIEMLSAVDEKVYISRQAVEEALERKNEFNFIHSDTGLKVDFRVGNSDDPELKERRAKEINDRKIYFVAPEELILNKLSWYQQSEISKHLEDIKTILNNSELDLDLDYVKKQAERQGTNQFLEDLLC